MGELVDLNKFREQRKAEEEAERERKEQEDIEYLRGVLQAMMQTFPPLTGGFHVPLDSNYIYDGTNTVIYPPEEDIAPSDQIFFDYDWGWASEDDDDI